MDNAAEKMRSRSFIVCSEECVRTSDMKLLRRQRRWLKSSRRSFITRRWWLVTDGVVLDPTILLVTMSDVTNVMLTVGRRSNDQTHWLNFVSGLLSWRFDDPCVEGSQIWDRSTRVRLTIRIRVEVYHTWSLSWLLQNSTRCSASYSSLRNKDPPSLTQQDFLIILMQLYEKYSLIFVANVITDTTTPINSFLMAHNESDNLILKIDNTESPLWYRNEKRRQLHVSCLK